MPQLNGYKPQRIVVRAKEGGAGVEEVCVMGASFKFMDKCPVSDDYPVRGFIEGRVGIGMQVIGQKVIL